MALLSAAENPFRIGINKNTLVVFLGVQSFSLFNDDKRSTNGNGSDQSN